MMKPPIRVTVTGAAGRPFQCSVPWQTSVTVNDFTYSTSYARGFSISGSIGGRSEEAKTP